MTEIVIKVLKMIRRLKNIYSLATSETKQTTIVSMHINQQLKELRERVKNIEDKIGVTEEEQQEPTTEETDGQEEES